MKEKLETLVQKWIQQEREIRKLALKYVGRDPAAWAVLIAKADTIGFKRRELQEVAGLVTTPEKQKIN